MLSQRFFQVKYVSSGGYVPGPGVVEILEEHFETPTTGYDVSWDEVDTGGASIVTPTYSTSISTWGTQCCRFNTGDWDYACLVKNFTDTPDIYIHFEFILRSSKGAPSDPSSVVLLNVSGWFEERWSCYYEVYLDFVSGVDALPKVTIGAQCHNDDESQWMSSTGTEMSKDVRHTVDIKVHNAVTGGEIRWKVDGVEVGNNSYHFTSYDDEELLAKFNTIQIGCNANKNGSMEDMIVDIDNIRVTTDDWA